MDSRIEKVLKDAAEAVAVLPTELRPVALPAIIEILWAEERGSKPVAGTLTVPEEGTSQESLAKLSRATALSEDALRGVYGFRDDGKVELVLPSVPGKSKREQQQNGAGLVLYAYQIGLGFDEVPIANIAVAFEPYGLNDTNRGANLKGHSHIRSSGKGMAITYKLLKPGEGWVKLLLKELTSAEGKHED